MNAPTNGWKPGAMMSLGLVQRVQEAFEIGSGVTHLHRDDLVTAMAAVYTADDNDEGQGDLICLGETLVQCAALQIVRDESKPESTDTVNEVRSGYKRTRRFMALAEEVFALAASASTPALAATKPDGWRYGAVLPLDFVSRSLDCLKCGTGSRGVLGEALTNAMDMEWETADAAYEAIVALARALHLRALSNLEEFVTVDDSTVEDGRHWARLCSALADDLLGFAVVVRTEVEAMRVRGELVRPQSAEVSR